MSLRLGPFTGTIAEQVAAQNFPIDQGDAEQFEKLRFQLTSLYLAGLITESEIRKVRDRLFKKVLAAVKRAM